MPRLALIPFLALLTLAPLTALAQTAPLRYVAVVNNDAPLRSGDLERFYRVTDLDAGAVLAVMGEEGEWLRVRYPAGLTAFVRARDAQRQGNDIVLNRPRKLRAANRSAGFNGSWKALLAEPMPAGARLAIIEEIVGPDGAVVGYRVPAPAQATGFIAERLTRAATPSEIDRVISEFRQSAPEIPDEPIQTPRSAPVDPAPLAAEQTTRTQPAIETPQPEIETATQPEGTLVSGGLDASSRVTIPDRPADAATLADNTPTGSSTTQQNDAFITPGADARPSSTPSIELADAATPLAEDAADDLDEDTIEDTTAEPLTIAELERRFQKILDGSIETTDVRPLAADYARFMNTLGDSAADRRMIERIEGRMELLRLRHDYRERVLALGNSVQEAGDAGLDRPRLADVQIPATPASPTRIVPTNIRISVRGELAPSLIYTGQGKPLLYRLVAPGSGRQATGSRTLAYVSPNATAGLASNLGRLVEVEGVARLAEQGQVRIIEPDNVRVLTR